MLRARMAGSWKRAVLLLVFTLSGASGLIYEVLWTRRLTHIFGSTTLAVSTVLAAFMGGLAVGSVLLGGWADRHRHRALRAYGLLEMAIGLLGFAIPLLLGAVELRLPAARAGARVVADGLLRRAVPARRPRARPAVRPHGRHPADPGALARGARIRDRRTRRRALRREHARGVRGSRGRDVRPAALRGRARGRARGRGDESRRGRRRPPARARIPAGRGAGSGRAGAGRGRPDADPGLRRARPAARHRALGLRGDGRRGGLGAPGRPRLRQLRLRLRPDAPALPRRHRDRQRDLRAPARRRSGPRAGRRARRQHLRRPARHRPRAPAPVRLHARLSRREGLVRVPGGAAARRDGSPPPADGDPLRHRLSGCRRRDGAACATWAAAWAA